LTSKKNTALSKDEAESDEKCLKKIMNETFSRRNSNACEPDFKSIHDYLISLVNDGSLEKQQTHGTIEKIAVELLQRLKRSDDIAHS
jgi:hypothetical protein